MIINVNKSIRGPFPDFLLRGGGVCTRLPNIRPSKKSYFGVSFWRYVVGYCKAFYNQ